METINNIKRFDFLSQKIDMAVITNVQNYKIEGYTMVINIGNKNAVIDYAPTKCILPQNSTFLKDVTIQSAESILLVKVDYTHSISSEDFETIWKRYSDIQQDFPKIPLFMSPQRDICMTNVNMYQLLNGDNAQKEEEKFLVKANFWFSSPNTDCIIHNQHHFMEVHTQIFGNGRMQKFKFENELALYEDILMSPGYTTPTPFCMYSGNGEFEYPWHRYYSDNNCVWLAIEYHAI